LAIFDIHVALRNGYSLHKVTSDPAALFPIKKMMLKSLLTTKHFESVLILLVNLSSKCKCRHMTCLCKLLGEAGLYPFTQRN